jgi:hypothetical protein
VFDCTARLSLAYPKSDASTARRRGRSYAVAGLAAVLLVPIAGAAEPPQGWFVASLTALAILVLLATVGERVRWGWLALLSVAIALVTPRSQLAGAGPVLFVASGLFSVLWLVDRGSARASRDGRPRPGSREREAQQRMGFSGERHVGQLLAHELPQDFVLINGLKLPRGSGDIDHLVVGPTGVFVLETKTMAGRIVCEADGTWRRTRIGRAGTPYAAYIGNPAAQVQRNIFAARDCLRRRLPRLFWHPPLWIEALVVFPHPRTELETDHSRVPAIYLEEAAARICSHVPQRPLAPADVDEVVHALLVEGKERGIVAVHAAQSAQAVVEVALALPLVLGLLLGTLALSRLIQAQTAVVAVAHEAARAGALANSAEDAISQMQARVERVALGLGLDPTAMVLRWDVSSFGDDPGQVVASVSYAVDLHDLPLAGWAPAPVVRSEHVEWVDPFRSGIGLLESAAR